MIYLFLTYLVFLSLFLIFNALTIYHILRFGYQNDASRIVLAVYLVICTGVIVATFAALVV